MFFPPQQDLIIMISKGKSLEINGHCNGVNDNVQWRSKGGK